MFKCLSPIFLIIAIGSLVIPAVYYWVYPHPGNVKRKIAELEKIHNERVAHIEEEIETAKRHQGGTRVYGGAEPWAQAERDELALQDKLSQENINYNKKIDELNKFPLTKALVLFGIFLTSIGLYLKNCI